MASRSINFERLWKIVPADFALGMNSVHGPTHWKRVEKFGLQIAQKTADVDVDVVRLFALFHDCRRRNEYGDPGHGARGAAAAFDFYKNEFPTLEAEAFEKLISACCWHTHQSHTDDPTIGACFDADRLDLGRVGITPDPAFLNTKVAKQIARS